jgi:hypothetical protein
MNVSKPTRCPACGAAAPLHAVHVIPQQQTPPDADSIVYMCAGCHNQLDRGALREFEFEIVLADLMAASPEYSDVRMGGWLDNEPGDRTAPDIIAKSADGSEMFVVECKSAQTIGGGRLRDAINQLQRYQIRKSHTI